MPSYDAYTTPSGDRNRLDDTVISHAHARALANLWAEGERPDFPITVLARSGAIRPDAEAQLERDLRLLTEAARTSGSGESIPQRQVSALLAYVRHHGPRGPVPGWQDLADDGEFTAETRRLARARRYESAALQPHALSSPSMPAADGRRGRGAAPRGDHPAGRRKLRLVRWEPGPNHR